MTDKELICIPISNNKQLMVKMPKQKSVAQSLTFSWEIHPTFTTNIFFSLCGLGRSVHLFHCFDNPLFKIYQRNA